jgi:peptidoglycan/xylan/chitin deacetylase (PgdA/CDA1 family)
MAVSFKALARDVYARGLQIAGLSSYRRRRPGDLLVLTFHRVLPEEYQRLYPLPGLAVTPEDLRWILTTLQPCFRFGRLSELSRRQSIDDGEVPSLAISFDDGQWDNVAFAAPVLRELGIPATFYLPTDFISSAQVLWHDRAAFAWHNADLDPAQRSEWLARLDVRSTNSSPGIGEFLRALKSAPPERRLQVIEELAETHPGVMPEWARMMTWAEAASLHNEGHEIGSHACSHGLLPQMSVQEQRRELEESSRAIAAGIGERPASLCYPNGSFDKRSLMLAVETGYENAVTTRWGVNSADQPRMQLLRCDMDAQRLVDRNGRRSQARLAMRLGGFQPGL